MSKTQFPIRIGIVGVGKIVRDQHLPALAANADYELVAAASRNASIDGVANFKTIEEMLAESELDAVSLCMPPQARYQAAIRRFLPASMYFWKSRQVRLSARLRTCARWPMPRECPCLQAGIRAMRRPLKRRASSLPAAVRSAAIVWKEDVRRWHPNQDWIWQAGGFGVFDPFINALSIVTHILPPLHIKSATLDFPANRDAPVAAQMTFSGANGLSATAEIDWLQTGPQSWDIIAETDAARWSCRAAAPNCQSAAGRFRTNRSANTLSSMSALPVGEERKIGRRRRAAAPRR